MMTTRKTTRKASEAAVASAATSRRSQRLKKAKNTNEEDPALLLFNELMAASNDDDKNPDSCVPPAEDVQPCSSPEEEAAIGDILDGLLDSAVRSGHKGLKKKQVHGLTLFTVKTGFFLATFSAPSLEKRLA